MPNKFTLPAATGWSIVLILSTPWNWFIKLGENQAYSAGLFIDYLILKIYLIDLVLFAWLGWWGWQILRRHTSRPTLGLTQLVGVGIVGGLQLLSARPVLGLGIWMKLLILGLFSHWIWQQRAHLRAGWIGSALGCVLLCQVLLGSYQFLTQKALGGYLLGGEVNLSQSTGIARSMFNGEIRSLAYGTLPHPNVLAGFVVVGCWWVIQLLRARQVRHSWLVWLPVVWTVFMTQSVSGAAALLLAISITYRTLTLRQTMVIGAAILLVPIFILLLPLPNLPSFTRRAALQEIYLTGFPQHLWEGTGLSQSTVLTAHQNVPHEITRFAQPAHHGLVVIITELGIIGVAAVLLSFKSRHIQLSWVSPFLLITPILAWDHYLVTLQVGWQICWLLWLNQVLRHNNEGTS